MELIIQILMLFIVVNCILKLSFWKWWQSALFGLVCAVFIVWMNKYAIMQSKTQLNDYLMNRDALQDAAVLVTVESAICFAFCFAALRSLFGKKIKKWMLPLYWYPSLLLFPVLFYILTQTIFSMSGTDFDTLAYTIAAITLGLLPAAAYGVKYMFPEKELRLEVHFLVSLFVAILGLLTTVNGNVTYAAAEEPINFKALALSLGLFIMMFLIGYGWNKVRWVIIQRKQTKNHL
ncbi:hypothetical protein [Dysgonomonas capnocytophagoides]|uniref:hypothetical protein n=1 Tax=Dysgonomonas capnocytophagoides TaxID=45254 RepID=UPI00291F771D|nr:hypothetical protein DCPSUM001_25730 [Dysgonomonas capnocytophagoides]